MNSLSGNKRPKYLMDNSWGRISEPCFCEFHINVKCILGSVSGNLRVFGSVWRVMLIYLFLDRLLDLIILKLVSWNGKKLSPQYCEVELGDILLRTIFINLIRWWRLIIIRWGSIKSDKSVREVVVGGWTGHRRAGLWPKKMSYYFLT